MTLCLQFTVQRETSQGSDSNSCLTIIVILAPIRMVTVEMSENGILCLSKDIFPAPRVQWSTLPPRAFLKPTTHMAASSEGLYSIQSQLRTLEDNPTYICTINSTYGSQSWRSSLKERGIRLNVSFILTHFIDACSLLKQFQWAQTVHTIKINENGWINKPTHFTFVPVC